MIFSSKIIPRTGTFKHVSFPCFKRTTFRVVLISLYRLLLSKAVLTFSSNLKIYEWYPGINQNLKDFRSTENATLIFSQSQFCVNVINLGIILWNCYQCTFICVFRFFFHVERNLRLEIYEHKS